MTAIGTLSISLDGIGHILADRRLKVPLYQRPYAWEQENIEELLRDLSDAMRRNAGEYFLGSIVTQGADSDLEVVDGQQRLATTSIIIAVIRDYMLEKADDRADEIEKLYLLTRDLRTRALTPKLTLNAEDNDFYQKCILARPHTDDRVQRPTKESHRRIKEAYEAAKTFINAAATQTSEPTGVLLDWLEYIASNLKVIWVKVPDDFNAFVIFETLNDRGVELSISDLLKNFLFGRAGERVPEVQVSWNQMIGALETVGGEDILLTYIRQRWSAQYGITREKALFAAIKNKITSEQAAVDLSSELAKDAVNYSAMLNPRHTLWSQFTPNTRHLIETLLFLRLEQYRPLLLAVLKKFSAGEVERTLRYMISGSVRFLINGGLGGGTLENKYCETAQQVLNGTITTAEEVAVAFRGITPSDSEFQSAFAVARVSKAYLARYYLNTLNRQATSQAEPELVVNGNADEVNLEHVLPKDPCDNWPEIDAETASSMSSRIGNLALMAKSENGALNSASFDVKKNSYANSSIILTKTIADNSVWGVQQIEERQAKLAALAVQAWDINRSGQR